MTHISVCEPTKSILMERERVCVSPLSFCRCFESILYRILSAYEYHSLCSDLTCSTRLRVRATRRRNQNHQTLQKKKKPHTHNDRLSEGCSSPNWIMGEGNMKGSQYDEVVSSCQDERRKQIGEGCHTGYVVLSAADRTTYSFCHLIHTEKRERERHQTQTDKAQRLQTNRPVPSSSNPDSCSPDSFILPPSPTDQLSNFML